MENATQSWKLERGEFKRPPWIIKESIGHFGPIGRILSTVELSAPAFPRTLQWLCLLMWWGTSSLHLSFPFLSFWLTPTGLGVASSRKTSPPSLRALLSVLLTLWHLTQYTEIFYLSNSSALFSSQRQRTETTYKAREWVLLIFITRAQHWAISPTIMFLF